MPPFPLMCLPFLMPPSSLPYASLPSYMLLFPYASLSFYMPPFPYASLFLSRLPSLCLNSHMPECCAAAQKSHDKVPGAKKRKRALDSGNLPDSFGQQWQFGMGDGADQQSAALLMALQQAMPGDNYLASFTGLGGAVGRGSVGHGCM